MNAKRLLIVCVVLVAVAVVLWRAVAREGPSATLTYSQFLDKVRSGQIASVVVMGGSPGATEAVCRLQDGSAARTVLPSDYRDALAAMQEKRVDIEIRTAYSPALRLIQNAAPFLMLLGVWIFVMMRKFPQLMFRT